VGSQKEGVQNKDHQLKGIIEEIRMVVIVVLKKEKMRGIEETKPTKTY